MKLSKQDRLNLISVMSETKFYESLPKKLKKDEIGLDRKRWSDLIQRLIDSPAPTGCDYGIGG